QSGHRHAAADDLRDGAAPGRGAGADARAHRQPAAGVARRRQGTKGAGHSLVSVVAARAASLLAAGATGALVVPGQAEGAGVVCVVGATCLSEDLPRAGLAASDAAHATSLLCDAPAGSGYRYADDSGVAGPSARGDDGGVHTCDDGGVTSGDESAGCVAGGGAADAVARCAANSAGRGACARDKPLTLGQLLRAYGGQMLD